MDELLALVENLEGVGDAMRGAYQEITEEGNPNKGKFILNVKGAGGLSLENVAQLRSGLEHAREDLRTAKSKRDDLQTSLGKYNDADGKALDPETVLASLTRLTTLDSDLGADSKVRSLIEATRTELSTKHQTSLDEKDLAYGSLMTQFQDVLITDVATRAMLAGGVDPDAVEVLMPHVKVSAKLKEVDGKYRVFVVDDGGRERITTKAGSNDDMTIEDLIGEFKERAAFKTLFKDTQASGGGTDITNAPPPRRETRNKPPEKRKADPGQVEGAYERLQKERIERRKSG